MVKKKTCLPGRPIFSFYRFGCFVIWLLMMDLGFDSSASSPLPTFNYALFLSVCYLTVLRNMINHLILQ